MSLNENTISKLKKVRTVVIVVFFIILLSHAVITIYSLESGKSSYVTVSEGSRYFHRQGWLEIPQEFGIVGPILNYGAWISLAIVIILVFLTTRSKDGTRVEK